ncbi:hypothetical protein QFC22_002825 [Naganishia vaughanmartiniae]|uniref:Uncharacterized protein n=1 Tax=Naganishia vaughanmartiniae TaxID=1424756 RepID=A0ACC2XBB5_9TREE|nr:hypothetical protein QFC22_002825 [Naganishia vaughanmartiniae]
MAGMAPQHDEYFGGDSTTSTMPINTPTASGDVGDGTSQYNRLPFGRASLDQSSHLGTQPSTCGSDIQGSVPATGPIFRNVFNNAGPIQATVFQQGNGNSAGFHSGNGNSAEFHPGNDFMHGFWDSSSDDGNESSDDDGNDELPPSVNPGYKSRPKNFKTFQQGSGNVVGDKNTSNSMGPYHQDTSRGSLVPRMPSAFDDKTNDMGTIISQGSGRQSQSTGAKDVMDVVGGQVVHSAYKDTDDDDDEGDSDHKGGWWKRRKMQWKKGKARKTGGEAAANKPTRNAEAGGAVDVQATTRSQFPSIEIDPRRNYRRSGNKRGEEGKDITNVTYGRHYYSKDQ